MLNNIFKITFALLLTSSSIFSQTKTDYKFAFGSGKKNKAYTRVLPSDAYSKEKGYGFDFDSKVVEGDRGGKDKVKGDLIKSDKPFYFSVAVP
ncbi:MAG: rhamnogalacturonan acetylesterase, partial [Flavobacteriales bacterium]